MSSHLPHRNRLLALEQELQSRRPMGVRQQKQHRQEQSPLGDDRAETMAVNSPPPPRQPHSAAPPEAPPSPSPWQVLADRLTQNQPERYIPSPPPLDLPPPDFAPKGLPLSLRHSTSLSAPEVLPTFPPVSPEDDISPESWQNLAAQIRQARSPQQLALPSSPTIPTEAESLEIEDFHLASPPELSEQLAFAPTSIELDPTDTEFEDFPEVAVADWEDDVSPKSWQDLATQIRQMRSPQQLALPPSPTIPTEAESLEIEKFYAENLPELSEQLAFAPASIELNPTDTESEDFLEFVVEDWEADAVAFGQSLSPISVELPIYRPNSSETENEGDSILTKQLVSLAQTMAIATENPDTSAIVPSQVSLETEIIPLIPTTPEGALATQGEAERGILTRYFPNIADSLLAIWRSPQVQRAIPWLACLIIAALYPGLFLASRCLFSTHW